MTEEQKFKFQWRICEMQKKRILELTNIDDKYKKLELELENRCKEIDILNDSIKMFRKHQDKQMHYTHMYRKKIESLRQKKAYRDGVIIKLRDDVSLLKSLSVWKFFLLKLK